MQQLPVYVSPSTGTDSYWKDGILIYTDGVRVMCEEHEAFWVLDVVRNYLPQFKGHEFLVVYFDVFDNKSCRFHAREDTDLPDIVSQHIEYTDLTVSLSLYLIDGILLMREEY